MWFDDFVNVREKVAEPRLATTHGEGVLLKPAPPASVAKVNVT